VLAEYEPAARRISYVNADTTRRFCAANGDMEKLDIGGVPLGIHSWPSTRLRRRFAAGDALIFSTDGVVEAFDESGAEFGNERCWRRFAPTGSYGCGVPAFFDDARDLVGVTRSQTILLA